MPRAEVEPRSERHHIYQKLNYLVTIITIRSDQYT